MLLNCRGRDGWWHHRLDGHEFEWSPGAGDGQGGLACCDSWGRKESDTTERLNCTEMNACKTELGKGRGIGRESLRLQCSSDLCENEGGSIWEKEARDYYSEIVSAGPTGNSCVMTPMQELALGKCQGQWSIHGALHHCPGLENWGGSWSHCNRSLSANCTPVTPSLLKRNRSKVPPGGYSGPLLFKIRGCATRVKRELNYLFRSCDAPSAILCFSPSDLLGRCQNSLFCDLMFLCSQFTIIIWLTAFSTRVHALYGLYGLLFCILRFCQLANSFILSIKLMKERKGGR